MHTSSSPFPKPTKTSRKSFRQSWSTQFALLCSYTPSSIILQLSTLSPNLYIFSMIRIAQDREESGIRKDSKKSLVTTKTAAKRIGSPFRIESGFE